MVLIIEKKLMELEVFVEKNEKMEEDEIDMMLPYHDSYKSDLIADLICHETKLEAISVIVLEIKHQIVAN